MKPSSLLILAGVALALNAALGPAMARGVDAPAPAAADAAILEQADKMGTNLLNFQNMAGLKNEFIGIGRDRTNDWSLEVGVSLIGI